MHFLQSAGTIQPFVVPAAVTFPIASKHAICTSTQLRVAVGEGAAQWPLHALGADQTRALYPDGQEALTGSRAS